MDGNDDAGAAVREVLGFWFGPEPVPRAEWFRKDPAFDEAIRQRFGATVERALAGELDAWAGTPEGTLALLVLLDQFPRNLFRGQARAFAGDARALALAREAVARGHDRSLHPVQRPFVYLPFEHSEDRAAQDESIRLFTALAAESAAHADTLHWAHRHREVILRFGRYPHRNAALGRASTPEELAFLAEPGSSF